MKDVQKHVKTALIVAGAVLYMVVNVVVMWYVHDEVVETWNAVVSMQDQVQREHNRAEMEEGFENAIRDLRGSKTNRWKDQQARGGAVTGTDEDPTYQQRSGGSPKLGAVEDQARKDGMESSIFDTRCALAGGQVLDSDPAKCTANIPALPEVPHG